VRHLLERIERLDPRFNAFLHVPRDTALAQAAAAEKEMAAGHFRGPLHGIPYALKDIVDVAGKAFDEAMLYRIAWQYCESTQWTSRHPPEPAT
jgi:Asp-tRNA(Asn)/Glu-tRNA(Gln) amidotransferase A subunit family amidase